MNWGHKILVVYLVFISGILFMVFKTTTTKTDLVTPDYYAQELIYQQKIDESGKTNALSAPPQITVNGKILEINFPAEFDGKKIEGQVLVYCPADKDKDVAQNFSVINQAAMVKLPEGYNGHFEIKLSWQSEDVKYYFEKKIAIPS